MRRTLIGAYFLVAAACGASVHHVATPVPPVPTDILHASCARARKTALPKRAEGARQGNAVALATTSDRTYAYVADADSHAIHTVSLGEAAELGHTRLSGAPRALLVLDDGRVVVTVASSARVAVLEPADDPKMPMALLCERATPEEPWGLALSANDAMLVVTSAWGASLTVLDGATLAPLRTVAVSRDPRDVLVDDKGVAFISHAVGAKLTTVNLESDASHPEIIDLSMRKATPLAQKNALLTMRTGSQGFALARMWGRILAPMVSVDPGDSQRRSETYYGPPFDGVPKEAPVVGVVDDDRKEPLSKVMLGTTQAVYTRECLLPRAAATNTDTSTLYVACNGIDAVLELDALAVDPFRVEKRRFAVPPDPEGLAVDRRNKQLVVFSQIGAALALVPLGGGHTQTIALDYRPDPELLAVTRGRQLFFRTDDTRISDDGLACASCHIDTREDGITWSTPLGPRQTPMLAGRLADTAPYGWAGDQTTVADYIQRTVMNLGGSGLPKSDLEELSRFVLATKGPQSNDAASDASIRRGRELFADDTQGCNTCHMNTSTDSVMHAFTATANDSLRTVDTPALRFVGGTAPYFHDGRYGTLEALLADPSSTMGHTSTLPKADQSALAAYLRTL